MKKIKQLIAKYGATSSNPIIWIAMILIFLAGALWVVIGLLQFFSR